MTIITTDKPGQYQSRTIEFTTPEGVTSRKWFANAAAQGRALKTSGSTLVGYVRTITAAAK